MRFFLAERRKRVDHNDDGEQAHREQRRPMHDALPEQADEQARVLEMAHQGIKTQ